MFLWTRERVEMIITGLLLLLSVLAFVWNTRNGLKAEFRKVQKERWAEMQGLNDRVKEEKAALEAQLAWNRKA